MKKILYLLLALVGMAACSNDEEGTPLIVMDDQMPSVTVIYTLSGPGDNGYNDLMVKGVAHFCDSTDVALHTFHPGSLQEAEVMVQKWLVETAGRTQRSMLVLAGSDYTDLATRLQPITDPKQCILLVESGLTDMPDGVVTANVERKGVMYLAGALSARTPAYILAAMPGDEVVDPAIQAFRDGYEAHSMGCRIEEVHYLSRDVSGYAMPNEAYQYMAGLMHEHQDLMYTMGDMLAARYILLPLAGSSNTGLYYNLMQAYNSLQTFQAVIGMDVDYSGRLDMVPFSVVVNVDKMLRDNLQTWINGGELPKHRTYTMTEGYADVVLNPVFNTNSVYNMQEFAMEIEDDFLHYIDFLPQDYWQQQHEALMEEAREYEGLRV